MQRNFTALTKDLKLAGARRSNIEAVLAEEENDILLQRHFLIRKRKSVK